ncbi:MAG: (2Fe-2S)-binding protein [Prevotellaceae bacterium]|jgi:NADH-quinone oxidoreductase subunit G/NADP-reducing hydrogenase subunit HndD|nr:(2Fe-2S)-binding protein [Prevotellaceae bacterium]
MTIEIDKLPVECREGETIIEAARRAEIAIPSLCYSKDAEHRSSCMVCVVKNADTGQMLPSCTTVAVQGMRLESNSEAVFAMRKASLELLLSDHYATCGTCASKNACTLRKHMITYKASFRRYTKGQQPPADFSPIAVGKNILFEPAKCIKCGLCVYNSKDGFTFTGRGFDMRVAPPVREGNWEKLVELCPCGALTKV